MFDTKPDHSDVDLEYRDIRREKKNLNQIGWFLWILLLVINGFVLCAFVYGVRWLFGDANRIEVTVIACATYVISGVLMYLIRLEQRINRMEMHALTVHNEIMYLQENQSRQ